jgi:hypothetical protein
LKKKKKKKKKKMMTRSRQTHINKSKKAVAELAVAEPS